jgi:uncharacterized protein YgbK (DUF1537 family)
MRNHPLTPMHDANLARVLGRQTKRKVGLVPYQTVKLGASAIAQEFAVLRQSGVRFAVVDAIEDGDLESIGAACKTLTLVTGGSGIAIGLPGNFREAGLLAGGEGVRTPIKVGGRAAVLAGSCSAATLAQVEAMKRIHPSIAVDPAALATNAAAAIAQITAWAEERLEQAPVLIYASAPPEDVAAVQARFGREQAGTMIESALAAIAQNLVRLGVRRLVVAGGETAGAVVSALGIDALEIGQQIAPGVPATLSIGEPRLALALKSGNFGDVDFFRKALEILQ